VGLRRLIADATPRQGPVRTLVWALLFGLAIQQPAIAGEAPGSAPRDPWTLEEALGLPERLAISIDQRTRYEYLDNQFRAGRPGSDQILALRTRVQAQLRITNWLSLGGEFQDSRAYLEDANTQVDTGLVNSAELLQAYLKLSFEGIFGGSNEVTLGRMTMDLGSRRLVARNRFRNTSNAFTGLDWIWRGEKGRELHAFYLLPVQRLPNDDASLRSNTVAFDHESADFQFFGLFFSNDLPWGDVLELYVFGDYEVGLYDPSEPDTTPNRQIATPGFRLWRTPGRGRFDYEIEMAVQAGQSRAGLDHLAHFEHLEIGYTFETRWSPRVILHYAYASGDKDPFDGDNGRFDTLFGARRFDYGPSSIYGAFARSNINTPGVRLKLRPGRGWTAFVDYRAVWLAAKRDNWVGTGVQDPTGASGSFVGQQIEFRLRWRPLRRNLMIELGSAHLFAGEFIDRAGNGGDTNYVYSQIVVNL
jgi:hypothetical protein